MIMSTKGNKDVVRRWNSGGEFWSLELLDKGYVNHGGTKAPWATVIEGLDEAKAAFGQPDPAFRVTVEDMIAEGDKVAVRMTFHNEGKPSANAMALYRLSEGKIVDDWFCWTPLEKG
jgi:predicted ester cyclase